MILVAILSVLVVLCAIFFFYGRKKSSEGVEKYSLTNEKKTTTERIEGPGTTPPRTQGTA